MALVSPKPLDPPPVEKKKPLLIKEETKVAPPGVKKHVKFVSKLPFYKGLGSLIRPIKKGKKSRLKMTIPAPKPIETASGEIVTAASTAKRPTYVTEEDQHSMHSGTDGGPSMYSGNSGLGSLVSHSINYFEVGKTPALILWVGRTDDDNISRKLTEESGESGDSDDTNSMNAENSEHE